LTRSKNVTSVTKQNSFTYCITLTGIDASQTVVVATPDYAIDATNFGTNADQAIVEAALVGGPTCPVAVITGIRSVSTNAFGVAAVTNTATAQPFFFVVP
jgi:hypothetical protein